jgi:hypothetical protein
MAVNITRTKQELNELVETAGGSIGAFIWVPETDLPIYTSAPEMLKLLTDILNRIESIQCKYRDKRENDIINEVKAMIDRVTQPKRLTDEA